MRIDAAGLRFIKGFEGFFDHIYLDGVGVRTIGYGTTAADVNPLPTHMTEPQAAALLRKKLDEKYGPRVRVLFRPGGPLHGHFTQARYNALVSFAYNLGEHSMPFRRNGRWVPAPNFETLGRAIIAADFRAMARALPLYRNKGSAVEAGLLRRRLAEGALLLKRPPRFTGFTRQERAWIEEFDRLKARDANPTRRRELRRLMTAQRKRIWRAAQRSGWDRYRRRARYQALLRRTR